MNFAVTAALTGEAILKSLRFSFLAISFITFSILIAVQFLIFVKSLIIKSSNCFFVFFIISIDLSDNLSL